MHQPDDHVPGRVGYFGGGQDISVEGRLFRWRAGYFGQELGKARYFGHVWEGELFRSRLGGRAVLVT